MMMMPVGRSGFRSLGLLRSSAALLCSRRQQFPILSLHAAGRHGQPEWERSTTKRIRRRDGSSSAGLESTFAWAGETEQYHRYRGKDEDGRQPDQPEKYWIP